MAYVPSITKSGLGLGVFCLFSLGQREKAFPSCKQYAA